MRKKRKVNPGQYRIAFHPEGTEQLASCWRYLKARYPGHLVLLIDSGHYVTVERDALALHQATGLPVRDGHCCSCSFPVSQWAAVLLLMSEMGIPVAICDPPDDPSQFLYT
jgi:hypothetical protein